MGKKKHRYWDRGKIGKKSVYGQTNLNFYVFWITQKNICEMQNK